MKTTRIVLSAVLASFLSTCAAQAQFGSGIVYDPTQSAHALQQIQQGENQLQKWATELNDWQQHLQKEAQIYTTAEQTRTQIVTMYNLAYQMSTMPQNLAARYKADFAQWSNLAAPPNTYGNTSQLVNALNFGGLPQASQGYNNAFVQPQSYPSTSYSSLDSLTQAIIANQYATSELAQATTTSAVATLGTIRSDSQAFAAKLANLETDTFSTDPAQQTQNALLGKINSATLLQIHSQQDTNQLLAASIQQQLLAQKQQIDAQNRAINNAVYFQQNFSNTMQNVTSGVSDSIHAISLATTGQ
jgi:outer membrane lipoprotein SlyB